MADFSCEGCGKDLNPGDKAHHCADGVDLCESCAPTFREMLIADGDDNAPEVSAGVSAWIKKHLAAGGSLSDKAVVVIEPVSAADLERIQAIVESIEDAPVSTETQH